jgi:photosystem II stability/assembly factor-like uncharacterized protein
VIPQYSLSRALAAALALAVAGLALLPAGAQDKTAPGKDPAREKQIADIEKQIADLTKRLDELKKAPAPVKSGPPEPALPASWTGALHWRCIGPASMGGRIVALSVFEADPSTYWVATASGGLLKTSNNGVTFEHQFDREATVSIGDVCAAPSDRNIVWVGTGENNPRNSVSYGDGVYKSTDGGKTWKNMALKKSFQIGKIVVHPKNPDIVYVGVLGRLYGPSEERGLYKTTDGGKTWTRIHFVDNHTGVIDIRMHPTDPETLLFATWDRQRDAFDSHAGALAAQFARNAKVEPPLVDGYDAYDPIRKWGPGGGIWKTTDGGKTFKRLTKGLPTSYLGRVGLDWYRKDPNVVYAIVDCAKIGMGRVPPYLGVRTEDAPNGSRVAEVTAGSPAAAAGLLAGDVVTAADKQPIKTSAQLVERITAGKVGDKLSLTLVRGKETKTIEVTLGERLLPDNRPGNLGFKGEDTPNGVRVLAVSPEGRVVPLPLQTGDIITAVGAQKVTTRKQIDDALRAAAPGSKLVIKLTRGGTPRDEAIVVPRRNVQRATRPYAYMYSGQRENVQNQQGPDSFEYGGLYRSADGGESWVRVNSVNPRPMYFSQVRVDPGDDRFVYVLGIRLYRSADAGKSFQMTPFRVVHDDLHAMWIDPRDGRHVLVGSDGGPYVSYDRCEKWEFISTMAIGQFYHVAVDTRRPYRVYGGLQDNGSWGGPSRSLDGRGPINADWRLVQGGDGYVCRVDPNDPDTVYAESQDGNMTRGNVRTGQRTSIRPRAPAGQPYRFNWCTPFILSHHNSRVLYSAGNYVFRSLKRGDDARVISPEITTSGKGSATALGESPRNADVLWVGTDDGNLWVTRDGGAKWTNVIEKVGLPRRFCVATVEPSRHADGRCYVCFDAHRSDDDRPYLCVTEDYGQTWKPLHGTLPDGSSRCLREDLFNPDVLYLGTEFSVFASIDRGATWTRINNNLPTVAVHELAQHPTAGEMVAATHGRSLWVLDVAPLRQLKPAMTKAPATLLAPQAVVRWRQEPPRGTIFGAGNHEYFGENPLPGAQIYYALTGKAKSVRLAVLDYTGKTIMTLPVKNEPGLHRVGWDLRGSVTGLAVERFLPAQVRGRLARGGAGVPAPAGQYRVVLTVDGTDHAAGLRLESDPTLAADRSISAEERPAPPKREEPVDH